MKKPITVIGLDLAKSVFQVHGIDAEGAIGCRRKLPRLRVLAYFAKLEPCLVGMEACATAHHWAREITALGHEVKLMPPQYVKPYVKTQKNDMADAEAICEAVTRPTMRFVSIKTTDQQALLVLHGVRDQWVRSFLMTDINRQSGCTEPARRHAPSSVPPPPTVRGEFNNKAVGLWPRVLTPLEERACGRDRHRRLNSIDAKTKNLSNKFIGSGCASSAPSPRRRQAAAQDRTPQSQSASCDRRRAKQDFRLSSPIPIQ